MNGVGLFWGWMELVAVFYRGRWLTELLETTLKQALTPCASARVKQALTSCASERFRTSDTLALDSVLFGGLRRG